jgi:Spy/CpxP family protein refolding chaperone
MQRSKQQAMLFLLGAVLVGGVLGFSAERVLTSEKPRNWAPRQRMYDDLGLTVEQRSTMDSLLDERNCQISAVMKPVRPHLDSIKKSAHEQVLQVLTPAQREKLELRSKEMEKREAERRANATKSTSACKV